MKKKYPTNFKVTPNGWNPLTQCEPSRLVPVQIAYVGAESTIGHPVIWRGIARIASDGKWYWDEVGDDPIDVHISHWKHLDNTPCYLRPFDSPRPESGWKRAQREPVAGEDVEIIFQGDDGIDHHGFARTYYEEGDEEIEEGTYWKWGDSSADPGSNVEEQVRFWKPMDPLP